MVRRAISDLKRRNRKFVTAFILLGLLPGMTWGGLRIEFTSQFILSCLVTFYAAWRLTSLSLQYKQRFLQLTFWLFVYCWLGLAASAQIAENRFPWPNWNQTPENLIYTEIAVIVGCGAYEIGIRRKRNNRALRKADQTLTTPSCLRFSIVTIAGIVTSAVSIHYLGGLAAVLVTRAERTNAPQFMLQSDGLVLGSLQHVPPIIALLVALYLWRQGRYRGANRIILNLFILILLAANFLANYPPALARVTLGSYGIPILLLFIQNRSRLTPLFTIAMAVALTVAFPYTDYFRTNRGYSAKDLENPVTILQTKPDYDAFQMLSNTMSVVQDKGVDYGYHVLGSFLFFVPRRLWVDKPVHTGEEIGADVGYQYLNLSCPLWAELDYAGGFAMLFIGFYFYGLMTRRLEGLDFGGTPPASLLIAYMAGFQIFLLRGALMNAIAFSIPSLVTIWCFIGKIDPLSRRAQRPNPAVFQYLHPSNTITTLSGQDRIVHL